jgi:hypothetical protein
MFGSRKLANRVAACVSCAMAILAISICLDSSFSELFRGTRQLHAQGGRKSATQRIRASDIGDRVLIIGLLGHPLGEVVTIQGEWLFPEVPEGTLPGKDHQLELVITLVNGKRLDKPPRFSSSMVSPIIGGRVQDIPRRAGDVWEVRGIESGRYRGIPADILGELYPHPMAAIPQMTHSFGYYTEFYFSSCRIIRRSQGGKASNPPAPDQRIVPQGYAKDVREP